MKCDFHQFGGAWTETKLEIVSAYAKAFQIALKNQHFDKWYIDPFAGSGERAEKRIAGGLWEGRPLEEEIVTFAGSAKRALEITPQFDHYRFADTKLSHVEALGNLASEYKGKDIQVCLMDGNDFVQAVLKEVPWNDRRLGWRQRGVIFLDPYGMDVSWKTLQLIASTERLDVWFLFAAKAVRQQLGPSLDKVDAGKAAALDRFFGEPGWREEFFRPIQGQIDLFGESAQKEEISVNLQAIGDYAQKRFRNLFRWVSPPKSLTVKHVPNYFQLYCMTNSPSPAASALIERLHTAVVKQHEKASHQKSGH